MIQFLEALNLLVIWHLMKKFLTCHQNETYLNSHEKNGQQNIMSGTVRDQREWDGSCPEDCVQGSSMR